MNNTLEYLIAYLVVGVITSIGTSLWFVRGSKVYVVVGFFLINLFFYPLILALFVQDSVFGYKHNIKCAWCGEAVDFNDPEQAQEHVRHCQKHPTLTKIAKLQEEITKLRSEKLWDTTIKFVSNAEETIRLRQLVTELKEDGERLDDWCDHTDDCHVFRGGMNGDGICDCGYEHIHEIHASLIEKVKGIL